MKCIIIDDEPLARKVLARHLEQLPQLELVGSYAHAMQGFEALQQQRVDVIFLDIQMPQLNGLAFLKSLKKKPWVILCTAYREYALQGFELDVVDYLVKPIAFDRFLQAIDKLYGRAQQPQPSVPSSAPSVPELDEPFIFVKADREHVKIKLADILYLESLKNHLRIKTTQGEIITLKPISQMEEQLPPQHFIRVHRSFIIALRAVERFTQSNVTVGGQLIPIGRLYKQGVLKRLEEWVI
ncbi:MAG: LytTR family DNA-binding domain-containing protein [Bacteroidota bacterium]